MADPIKRGKIKWFRHTANITQRKFVPMTDNFGAALEENGWAVGPETRKAYREGIREAAQHKEPFAGPTAKAADKWERNYIKAMAR